MSTAVRRIEIAGGIASGKTTLSKLLRRVGLISVHENFKQNPFYAAFYSDPEGNAFETEITFLLQHYHQQKVACARGKPFCADFSLLLDRAYASVTLKARDQGLFGSVLRRAEGDLRPRSLLVHLVCDPEIELRRIRRRRRKAERRITVEYLSRINDALRAQIAGMAQTQKVLTIDSGRLDFASNETGRFEALKLVRQILQRNR